MGKRLHSFAFNEMMPGESAHAKERDAVYQAELLEQHDQGKAQRKTQLTESMKCARWNRVARALESRPLYTLGELAILTGFSERRLARWLISDGVSLAIHGNARRVAIEEFKERDPDFWAAIVDRAIICGIPSRLLRKIRRSCRP